MNVYYVVIIYLLVDIIWVTTMNSIVYHTEFSRIQGKPLQLNRVYGLLAYMVLVVALLFICDPLSKTYTRYKWSAFSLVGFCIYSIFNFTNAAVFTDYSFKLVFIDTLWGTLCFTCMGLLLNH